MLFIVTFNHDHHESAQAFATREAACAAIGKAFGIDPAEGPPDGSAFWLAVQDAYKAGPWKGVMLYQLDADALSMRALAPEAAPERVSGGAA